LFESGKIKHSRSFLHQIPVTLSAVFSQIEHVEPVRQVFAGGKNAFAAFFNPAQSGISAPKCLTIKF
jgi:hypothetical protein